MGPDKWLYYEEISYFAFKILFGIFTGVLNIAVLVSMANDVDLNLIHNGMISIYKNVVSESGLLSSEPVTSGLW